MAAFSIFRRFNQRLSMTTKTVVLGVLLFSIALPILNTYYLKRSLKENVSYDQKATYALQEGALALLAKKDISAACGLMQNSLERGLLRFYIIQMNGNNICSGPAELEKEINIPYTRFGKPIDAHVIRFRSEKLDPFVVTVATYNDSWASFWVTTKPRIPSMLVGWLLGVIGASIIAFVISIPFRRLSLKHQGHRQEKSLLDVLGSSREAVQAHRASEAFSTERERLKAQISFIAPDFSKSLTERMIKENAEFPYSFAGTILRFDLNGYTKLYYANNKEMIARIMQAIAVDVDEMVNRYGGNHYGFGGDEFVELFEGPQQKQRALYCARAIFSIAQRIDLPEEIRRRVKFKAALAADEAMLFSRLPQCYSLVADSLILTNRYFSAIDDRDTNSLILSAELAEELKSAVSCESLGDHKFKNIEHPLPIAKVSAFEDLQSVLNDERKLPLLDLFRSDQDLLDLFRYIRSQAKAEIQAAVLRHLKGIRVTVCPPKVAQEWLETLRDLKQTPETSPHVLSSFINTGKNLLPRQVWTQEMTEILLLPDLRKDTRVVADIVELFSYKLTPREFDAAVERILDHGASNRAHGNRLLAQCLARLDKTLVGELGLLLKSDQPGVVATGIYCVSRVVEHFRVENPVVLSQFLEFNDYIGRIKKLQDAKDPMVSARARVEMKSLEGISYEG